MKETETFDMYLKINILPFNYLPVPPTWAKFEVLDFELPIH